jgi:uncharacterized protein
MTARAPRPGFQILAKPGGPICNLDCRYCFYLEKEHYFRGTSRWAMPDDVLETFIRGYIAAQDAPVVSFAWQGGEPTLLGVGFFERVVEFQRRHAGGRRIENGFQTNGILLDDRWGRFLAEHDFLVGLSVDGPREIHDRYRVDRGGQPTFDRVMKGIEVLQRHRVEFNTLTVVHRDNARAPHDVYRFLKGAGSRFLQFIPIVERIGGQSPGAGVDGTRVETRLEEPGLAGDGRVAAWSVDPADWGAFLCAIFDEWVRRDVGQTFVQLFDVALEAWYGRQAPLCLFSPTCGRALAVEHNGDLYSCDHYVFPAFKLGNVMTTPIAELVDGAAQRRFGEAKRETLPAQCRRCPVLFACNGECPKNRFARSADGEPGLNYLCAGYRRFFSHIDAPMRFMAGELAAERPPANVMAWTLAHDRQRELAAAGRNDPCPCGSGKKYKRCCGL